VLNSKSATAHVKAAALPLATWVKDIGGPGKTFETLYVMSVAAGTVAERVNAPGVVGAAKTDVLIPNAISKAKISVRFILFPPLIIIFIKSTFLFLVFLLSYLTGEGDVSTPLPFGRGLLS
jgi:hypothetical protein